MLNLTVLVLLVLASYRVTRFLIFDSIIEDIRVHVHNLLSYTPTEYLRGKVHELVTCTWCLGVYVSALVYFLYTRDFQISNEAFLNIAAIAAGQGLIHSFEPDES